ncbi:DUF488 family protein [Mesorhizobium sangaii]|uniref:DUF488 domain-containing protein n=1 Tax=Mesorhizobium sangaii TaxID=505389 RepID=A0A841PEB0_9HYPH|nr:DUF488 family protein [Mesorhizobium sangaii]MBB6413537.1 hypothetical protein [Mesorhizobium sangaii]
MKIVTSSFFTKLPVEFAPISIARWAPQRFQGPTLRELTPGEWFRSIDVDEYRRRYLEQLDMLDPRETVRRIQDLAAGRAAALLCWERPRDGNFCHRGYVSAWLRDELGIDIYELGLDGCGHHHPKLPEAHRPGPTQPTLL